MTLRLDPRFPLVWRSPDSAQLGIDRPVVTFEHVPLAEERMLYSLTLGATRGGISVVAAEAGYTELRIERFLSAVQPALLPKPQPSVTRSITVLGTGPTANAIATLIAESGHRPRVAGSDVGLAARKADAAIALAHFVLEPELHGLWLRRDIPHLPVVFGDTSVRVGPLIEPGLGPCLHCLERHRADADPAWPAIASQLLGQRGLAETAMLAAEAASTAARLVLNRFAAGRPGTATSVTIDAATGERHYQAWSRHPDCGCAGVDAISATRRGTGTAAARGAVPRAPRRGAAASVPA
ncbi:MULTISPECIES: TOMM precursor leader peptide-binding protein [unclassified Cryobacterium]|uniref:TOMM precursor leader peptide-binding protein n=1 Tax=unclassified Cryobacterium TaxID=2649013 RepID=UPI001445AE71|nr:MULTISPECIES: TOMM precursor leader peptide-binding protein [unclassified Cryobacterium]